MAVLPKYPLGSAVGTASSTTIPIPTINQADLGDLIVVRAACDNLSATAPTFTCTDLVGNVYTTVVQKAQNATPNSGAACAIIVTRVTVALPAASTITVVLSGAVGSKAAYAETFTDCGITVRASNSLGQAAASTSGSGAATPAIGDLVLGVAAVETSAAITGDPDTTGGPWSAMTTAVANTGTSLTSMSVAGQWKVSNANVPSNYNVTWTGVTDYAGAIVALVPEVYVPPDPPVDLGPDHIKIGDLIFCVPAHGVGVHVEIVTPTQTIDATDIVQRATWQQGGAYDAAGSPWFNPTPNPCELELRTTDPRWDPTSLDAYDLVPLATSVRVILAEQASFGPGGPEDWTAQNRFYGPLLAHTYEPKPGGGPATVQLSAADALTNLGDMVFDERPEETPAQRLIYLASGVKDLAHSFATGAGYDTPVIGRYHPSAGTTRLQMMNEVALAAGLALMFVPADLDEPAPYKTLSYTRKQGAFSNPGVCFTAAVDPQNGMTLNTAGGDVPWFEANNRIACLTDIALARHDAGFRTRITSQRKVAYWMAGEASIAGTVPPPGAGGYQYQSPIANWEIGDTWEHTLTANTVTGPAIPTWRAYVWNGSQPLVRANEEIPIGIGGVRKTNRVTSEFQTPSGAIGRFLFIPTGGSTFGAPAFERFERLAGNGPPATRIFDAAEAIYGERAVTGWQSPIRAQADLVAWNDRALRWVIAPTFYPRLLRVATSAAHPSPGVQQWAVHLTAGARLALRHKPWPAGGALDLPTIQTWAVNLTTTLTPLEVTVDVECGPQTTGSA